VDEKTHFTKYVKNENKSRSYLHVSISLSFVNLVQLYKKKLMYFLFSLKHFYELILNIIYYGAL